MESSDHFETMLRERGIKVEWAEAAIADLLRIEDHQDGTRHFLKPVAAFGGRWLRVLVSVQANREVTAFFDWTAEETDHPREVVEAALVHVVRNKVEAAYKRTDLVECRRRLMEDWAAYLAANRAAARHAYAPER